MTAPSLPLPWIKATEMFFTPSPARLYSDNAVWFGDNLGAGNYGPQGEGQWHSVDLRPFGVAADAIAACLSGMLIVTHGNAPETADMKIVFRRLGDVSCPVDATMGQCVEAHVGGGQRSTMSTWVPLYCGCFEYAYTLSTAGDWPANSGYGVNLSLQAWAR